jgi:hypothetical protein
MGDTSGGTFQNKYFCFIAKTLKGQSHKKVGEMRVQGDSLGPNYKQLLLFKIF